MTAMPTIEVVDLTEIVGDMEIPCDYAGEWSCRDEPARWVMHLKPCCGAVPLAKLACETCKEHRLMDSFSLTCAHCGYVFEHAPEAYRLIEPLKGKS